MKPIIYCWYLYYGKFSRLEYPYRVGLLKQLLGEKQNSKLAKQNAFPNIEITQ